MKKAHQYLDPVNYQLAKSDPKEGKKFASFLNELTDVPASQPLHNLHINEAGIKNQQIVVSIQDIDGRDFVVPVVCDVTLKVDLHNHRGIHMSRCEQVLFEASKKTYKNLDEFALVVAKGLRETQKSETSFVRIVGSYLHRRLTRKSKKESQDRIYLISNVVMNSIETKVQTGMKVYNMTACPCTRTFTKYSVVPKLVDLGLDTDTVQKILDITHSGTHTQRGTMLLLLDKTSEKMTHAALHQILDESCHLIYELLKRPDEHELVVRALSKPQFTEDVVREVVFNTYKKFPKVPKETVLVAESILLDSIHIHDVCTKIERSFEDIKIELAQQA
jgi:MptA/FolE2 family GTP cyclohydrolase